MNVEHEVSLNLCETKEDLFMGYDLSKSLYLLYGEHGNLILEFGMMHMYVVKRALQVF